MGASEAASGNGGQAAFSIRQGRPEDSARCQAIAVAAWQPIHEVRRRLLGPRIYQRLHTGWREAKAAEVGRVFAQRPEWTRVAVIRDDEGREQVAGFVTFQIREAERVGVIGNNAVDPAFTRRGIATALYRHVLDVFRAAGMQVAQVTTGLDEGHAPALHAYRKVGFSAEAPSVTLYQEL
jgi:ribosomal protein S18 acetylase RimI-like enzyme